VSLALGDPTERLPGSMSRPSRCVGFRLARELFRYRIGLFGRRNARQVELGTRRVERCAKPRHDVGDQAELAEPH
jgi:hypothetical protein